jgi:hypothetical protein
MSFLLAAALAFSGSSASFAAGEVVLHEWGVVEFGGGELQLLGVPEGFLDDRGIVYPEPGLVQVHAPVIWFHGDFCDGTLTVEISGGRFTKLIPPTDSIISDTGDDGEAVRRAVWSGLSIREALITSDDRHGRAHAFTRLYGEALFPGSTSLWRSVPANGVVCDTASYRDRFVFYEASVPAGELFDGDCHGCEGEALLFSGPEGDLACVKVDVPFSAGCSGTLLSEEDILRTMRSWRPGLLEEEVDALWITWEPLIRSRCIFGGESLLLFPLTGEQTESISRIGFTPDGSGTSVGYERLFVGLCSLPERE